MSSKEILLGNALQKDEQSVQVGFPSVVCGFAGERTRCHYRQALQGVICSRLLARGSSAHGRKYNVVVVVNSYATNPGTTGLRDILCLLDKRSKIRKIEERIP